MTRSATRPSFLRSRPLRLLPAFLLLIVPFVSACGDWIFGPGDDPVDEITELPRALSASETAVIEASNRFAFDLLREVAADEDPGQNVVLSPLSASMALGMTLNGADGNTFDEMRSVLGLGTLEQSEINAAYRDLLDLLYELDPTVEFRIGNSIWHREGFEAEEDFLDTVRERFDAEVAGLDFSSQEAARTINAWVRERTNGRIEEIVEHPIDPLTVMFLVNAIYFDGAWTEEFDPDRTREADFRRGDGTTVTVPMMQREEGPLRLSSAPGYTAAELTYGGRAYAMTLLLPPEGTGLRDFAASLDEERWTEITAGLGERRAALHLPRFRLEYEEVLNGALHRLGMEDAFDPGRADFTRMYRRAKEVELHVKEVKQKTWIDVNEEGTEAAAATSVEMGVTSAPPTIRVDRPFLFALRERLSGTILFVGLVEDPTGS